MPRYLSSKEVTKAQKCKVYRDQAREKFFREGGAKKGVCAKNLTGTPYDQSARVGGLLKLSAKGSLPVSPHWKTAEGTASIRGRMPIGRFRTCQL